MRRAIPPILLTVAVVFGLPLLVYYFSVQPGAAIIRWLFELEPLVQGSEAVPLERSNVQDRPPVTIQTPGWPDARLDLYAPIDPAAADLPVVLWLHGGAFIANSANDVAPFARILADNGYVVAALEYSLAPGANYPTPVVQANAALAWLKENAAELGGDPDRFVVGGDSAGAQIASQLAAVQTDADFAEQVGVTRSLANGELQAVILYCGIYNMDTLADTGFPGIRTPIWAYVGQRDWQSFERLHELSTVRNVHADYPPTFVAAGDADSLSTQSYELAEVLESAGVPVTTQFWTDRGLGHEYQFKFELPEAVETLANTLEFMAEHSR